MRLVCFDSDAPDQMQVDLADDSEIISVDSEDSVNCTANGQPLPVVLWIYFNDTVADSARTSQTGPGWALLTFATPTEVGTSGTTEMWMCSASNSYVLPPLTRPFTFKGLGQKY